MNPEEYEEIMQIRKRIRSRLSIPAEGKDGKTIASPHKSLERGCVAFFFTILLPLLLNVPIYGFSWVNPCLSYATVLQVLSLGLFGAAFLLSWPHLIFYNAKQTFCTQGMIISHHKHSVILFGAMGGTLGFFNLYAWHPNAGFLIGGVISYLATIIAHLTGLYQKHRFIYCDHGGEDSSLYDQSTCCRLNYGEISTLLGVLFLCLWLAFVVVYIQLSPALMNEANRAKYVTAGVCLSLNSTS